MHNVRTISKYLSPLGVLDISLDIQHPGDILYCGLEYQVKLSISFVFIHVATNTFIILF